MRGAIQILCALFLLSGAVWAADIINEITTTDGITYEHVRWGPVNNGKVVIFHNRGMDTVPLEKLPERWARKFGYRPSPEEPKPKPPEDNQPPDPVAPPPPPVTPVTPPKPSPPPSMPDGPTDPVPKPAPKDPSFEAERDRKMVLDGALVDREQLTVLFGFVRGRGRITEDNNQTLGVILELARRKNDGGKAPTIMEMRPGLWDGTGEQVFLRDYPQDVERDSLIRVYGRAGDEVNGYKTYHIATELTPEQWKKLH